MADQDLSIITPSIAKSASIATVGKSWRAVGPTGEASFELPLPMSGGRGAAPQLSLTYSSQSGNGPFGIGWNLSNGQIRRRTNKGVPRYGDDDEIIGHDAQICMPERNNDGTIKSRLESRFNGKDIGPHAVVLYSPEVESVSTVRERWTPVTVATDEPKPIFWLVYSPDGSLQVYGKTEDSRSVDPEDPLRVAIWYLCENMTARGEHVCWVYEADARHPDPDRDYRAQRYLRHALYGNFAASQDLYAWTVEDFTTLDWHFHLLFDYGERSVSLTDKPAYVAPHDAWLRRPDVFSTFGFGFETGTRRLCRQVLMFHHFPDETGEDYALIQRLLLEYSNNTTQWAYSRITAAHYQSWDASGAVENTPPLEFDYTPFTLNLTPTRLLEMENMPGIEDGGHYQCVDLYGEGVPGFLCRMDQAWYYREPTRGASGPEHIAYDPWKLLDAIPVADRRKPVHQLLTDLTGNGRLDWVMAQPGISGFRTLEPDRTWAQFEPFAGFPLEFFSANSQLGDLAGEGLLSLAVIGPRSVRLYPNQLEDGFGPAQNVLHEPDNDRLPLFSDTATELVFFGNLLGSDTTGLCRIRHDEIKCWPNLGHGKFGKGRVLAGPAFSPDTFDSTRLRIADLDGSGAPALIWLKSDAFEIYLNRGGDGFALDPIEVPWPEGAAYDRLCQVTLTDLQGLGCASLILTVPHMTPRHWRYDFVATKPYLIVSSNNNMGCSASVVYRSSAQEWLDEKQERRLAHPDKAPACFLPFTVQLVKRQRQLDEITGNCLNQGFTYREGYYDPHAREYRGFGHLQQVDSETATGDDDIGFTAPIRTCSWFIIGQFMNRSRDGYFAGDPEAVKLGDTLIARYAINDECNENGYPGDETLAYEIARGMSGTLMRTEVFADADDPVTAKPYRVEEYRYRVRELRPKGDWYPDAVILPLPVEKISYHYDRFIEDPLCRHEVTLDWSEYGLPTHALTISYARRRTDSDPPPFDDPDEKQWWRDAHDPAQQLYYISESRSEFLDLDSDLQHRRLGLPYLQRGNAIVLAKGALPSGLTPSQISYCELKKYCDSDEWNALRVLTGQSVQRYLKTEDGSMLPDGVAEFEALAGPLEIAQLDKTALDAYGELPPPFDIRAELANIGYNPMPLLFENAQPEDTEDNLWSAHYGFANYAGLSGFFKVQAYNETLSHGVTKACYDNYYLNLVSVELPDGCTTRIEYDHHTLQPVRIIDANENIEEVIYEPSGLPLATSFYGTENGLDVGFDPLSFYVRPADYRPDPAIADPSGALQKAATTLRKDLFSWMGQLPLSVRDESPQWLAECINAGLVLPSLHIRSSARARLKGDLHLTEAELALRAFIASAHREPVHHVNFAADRYPDDPEQQIQIAKVCVDGFGRTLQTQQLVEPGMGYAVGADGSLIVENGQFVEVFADPRWRISERVEYNNKGLAVRQFRPFFANHHHYVNDESLRTLGFFDQLFYDVLGRPVKLINAKKHFSRDTYHPWYHISEDFNDTAEEQPQP